MAQTSYSINLPSVAFPGQPADIAMVNDNVSALAVAAAIPYGVLVVRDLANGTPGSWEIAGKLPSADTDITTAGSALGVAVADQARAQDPSVAVPTYPQFAAVPCKRVGRIWVKVEVAVTAGQAAYVRFAPNAGLTQLGAFRNDDDFGHAAALPNAVFVTSQASAGGYAVVELSLI